MKTTDAIRSAVKASGHSMRALSSMAGRSDNYISGVVGQAERMGSELTGSTIATIAEACDYSLALVPHADVPGSALVIDPPDESGSKPV